MMRCCGDKGAAWLGWSWQCRLARLGDDVTARHQENGQDSISPKAGTLSWERGKGKCRRELDQGKAGKWRGRKGKEKQREMGEKTRENEKEANGVWWEGKRGRGSSGRKRGQKRKTRDSQEKAKYRKDLRVGERGRGSWEQSELPWGWRYWDTLGRDVCSGPVPKNATPETVSQPQNDSVC